MSDISPPTSVRLTVNRRFAACGTFPGVAKPQAAESRSVWNDE